MSRRVVVTGLGIVSPVGVGVGEAWPAITASRSGIAAITRFDAQRIRIADRGRGKAFRRLALAVRQGGAPLRCVHSLRAGRDDGSRRGCRAREFSRRQGSLRTVHRLGHRRPAADRGDASRVHARWRAQDLAVLRSGVDRQHGRRAGIDPLWISRTQSRHGQRLFHRQSQHRRGGAAHQVRRRRRHGRRRRRSVHFAARCRRIRGGASAVDQERRSGNRQPTLGRRPRRVRAGRGRRRDRPRGIRACEGAERDDLLRDRRLWHERRCAPHHGAARGWRRRRPQHAECAARRRIAAGRRRLHQRPRDVDTRSAMSPSASR